MAPRGDREGNLSVGGIRKEGGEETGVHVLVLDGVLVDLAGCDTHGCWSWIPTVLGVFFVISSAS